jgi:hypothetical protein
VSDVTPGPVEVLTATRSGSCVVRPVGVLDSSTYRGLRDTLVKLTVEQPDALVVDLSELRIGSETALTVFSSVWMQVSEWPGVPVLLVTGDQAVQSLLSGAISRYTPHFATVADALAAAGRPPVRRLAALDIEAGPAGCRITRLFVRRTCQKWDLTSQVSAAIAVTNELVDNAMVHAGPSCQIRLELRGRMLTIAVRDDSSQRAVLRERVGFEERGNGLRIVAGLARTWGCAPHLSGGKVVWAIIADVRRT